MLLKTKIKINNVTNLHDARYCAGMGVELIGFPLDASGTNSMDVSTFNEIANWLEGIKYVAEISNDKIDHLKEYKVDFVEFSDVKLFEIIKDFSFQTIFKINLKTTTDIVNVEKMLENLHGKVDFFLIDVLDFDSKTIENLKKLAKKHQIILSGTVTKENINNLIDQIKPEGIALNSGIEIKTGYNDLDELADILEEIELD